jgi:hypothetical protein
MMLTKAAVERLDAIQPHRETAEWRERAAQEALNVVLLAAQPAVVDAYRRALARLEP